MIAALVTRLGRFTLLERGLALAALIVLVAFWVMAARLHQAEAQSAALGLKADTLTAALDTSHRVAFARGDSLKILGDSMQAVTRRVIQVAQRNDAIDKAMGLDRIALANLTAAVQALHVEHAPSIEPVRVDSQGTRAATFAIERPPYHGSASVELPTSGRGSIDLALHVDPATIGVRLACGAPVDGIKPASATLTGPSWLTLTLGRVEQSADLCRSPALETLAARPGLWRRLMHACGVGPSYALVLTGGRLWAGPGAALSCRVWP